MAADQRYCVECGERRGAPRVSLLEGPSRRAYDTPTPAPAPALRAPAERRVTPVSSTLVAIIGVLLLAIGIGVLIGRSDGNTSIKNPPAQIVTVSGAPATGAAGTQSQGATTTTPASGKSSSPSAKTKTKAPPITLPKSKTPLPKTVKVGTSGHGRGYQNGHFTGNFFGE
jgi:hypothetical protein